MLAFDEFAQRLLGFMEIDVPSPVNPYAGLYDELALDSFQTMQLIIIVESLAGIDVPPVELPDMYTLQDSYDYYLALVPAGQRAG